jgi:serine/threonine protein kinase
MGIFAGYKSCICEISQPLTGDFQANVFVDSHKRARIADFGFSIVITNTVQTDLAGGTAKYMAPERFSQPRATSVADIWSFGCVCYEVTMRIRYNQYSNLSNQIFAFPQHPYNQRSDYSVPGAHSRQELPGLFPAQTPDRICQVAKKCWSFESEKRPRITSIVGMLRLNPS